MQQHVKPGGESRPGGGSDTSCRWVTEVVRRGKGRVMLTNEVGVEMVLVGEGEGDGEGRLAQLVGRSEGRSAARAAVRCVCMRSISHGPWLTVGNTNPVTSINVCPPIHITTEERNEKAITQ